MSNYKTLNEKMYEGVTASAGASGSYVDKHGNTIRPASQEAVDGAKKFQDQQVNEGMNFLAQNPQVQSKEYASGLLDNVVVPEGHYTYDDAAVSEAMAKGTKVEQHKDASGNNVYYISGVDRSGANYDGTSGADRDLLGDKSWWAIYGTGGYKEQDAALRAELNDPNITPERKAEIENELNQLHVNSEALRYNTGGLGYGGYLGGSDGSMHLGRSLFENTGNVGGNGGYGSAGGSSGSYGVNSYEQYINDMYAAQKAAALAEIDAAYQKNVNAINRAGEGLSESYQAARNQTAGNSELSKRNFAQYAAANGLNSGTAGQAELARNVALQNNLNSINRQEAQSLADLELQKANAEVEYNNAIAQAEAEGNYELAAALYQEKVRYDNAMTAAIQQEFQNNLAMMQYNNSVQQQAWQNAFTEQQYKDSLEQQSWENLFKENQYKNSLTQNGQSTLQSKDDTGTPVVSPEPTLTYNQVMSAIESGLVTPAVKAAFEYYNGVSYDEFYGVPQPQPQPVVGSALSDLLSSNPLWNIMNENTSSSPLGQLAPAPNSMATVDVTLSSMKSAGANMTEMRAALREALNTGLIDQNSYDYLAGKHLTWGR